ncbi:MAG: hypothetical protein KGJ28_13470, partial [Alphaproteobacteria bacterium]|nr:hypothetical protein [Alphaproteobacteria bacterium]
MNEQFLSLLDSNFFSAAFGALFGALAAALIAARTERRRRLRDEIAACNVSLGLCVAVANVFIAIKRQSVRPMVSQYRQQLQALQAVAQAPAPGVVPVHVVQLDLKTVPIAWVPMEALNASISDRVGSTFEPAAVVASVGLAVHNQQLATNRR